MGLFGKSKKERETEYMSRLDVPSCLKEDFELIIDDIFTIMGVGTVATGNILTSAYLWAFHRQISICISVCFKNGQLRLELPTHCTNYAIFSCLHRFLHQLM